MEKLRNCFIQFFYSITFCYKNSLFQKHLGLTLDIKLNFSEYIKNKNITKKKKRKTMGLLRKFQPILPRSSLLTIYKTFIRSRLDYAVAIFDQAYNSAFHDKLASSQYARQQMVQ